MSETPRERQEAAATRRRWVSLAELVAVAGVLIGALGLYNNWSERRTAEAEKAVASVGEQRARARLNLVATVEGGGDRAVLRDDKHDLREVTIAFPKALGIPVQRPVAEAAIERDWFAGVLLKATDGGADEREGRLPVLVTASYWDDDVSRRASAVYDVAWRTEGRVLRGRSLTIEAVRLRQRGGSQAVVDAAWAREKPAS